MCMYFPWPGVQLERERDRDRDTETERMRMRGKWNQGLRPAGLEPFKNISKGAGGGGINWEIGTDIYTLLYIK